MRQHKQRTPWHGVRAACLIGLSVSLGACSSPKFNGDVVSGSLSGPPALTGTNWDGSAFDLSEHKGKVAIVFFGYTYCPDVCPMSLYKMQQLHQQLGEDADKFEVVFCSVDPYRDSPEKLAKYVPNFNKTFNGLALTFDEIEGLRESFGLTVQYGQPEEGPGTDSYYYVDHTGSYFLFDPQGRLRLKYPPNATVEDMLPDIRLLLAG